MIEEEKWALELLQLGSFAELVNTEELLKSCVSIVQRRRSKTPVTSEFHDSSSKDKDSDSDDNPVDPSDKEASKFMDQQRAELAGRFTGESSHSHFISEKGSEKPADVEDTVVFKTADVVLDAITSDLLKEIRSSEVITDADMQESITSDVSGSNYNSLDTLKEVLQIIKKTLDSTAEDVAPETDVASKEAQTVDKATAGSQTAAYPDSGKLFPDGIIRPTISTDDELVFSPTRRENPDSESETAENVQEENVCRDVIVFQQPQQFNNAGPSTSAAQPDFNFLQQTLTTVMNSVLDIQRYVRKMEREAESTKADMFSLERRMTSMDGLQYQFQLHMKNLSREVKDGFASVTAELQKPKMIKSKIDNLQEAKDGIIDALNSFTDATNTFRLENQGLSAVVHENISDLRDNLDALIFYAANKGEILVIDPSAAQKLVMQKKLSRAVDSLKIAENGRVSLTEYLRLEFNDKWNEGRSLPFKNMDYVAALRTFLEFKVFKDRLKAWRTRRNEKIKREGGRVRLESAEELLQIFMDEYLSGLFGPETISIQKAWTYWKIYNPVTSFDSVEDKLQNFIAEQVADAAELEGQQNIS